MRAQIIKLVGNPDATANIGGNSSTRQPHFRERTPAVNQHWVQHNVDPVGQDQRTHGDTGITRTPEDGIVEEQKNNSERATEHDARIGFARGDDIVTGTHQGKNAISVKEPEHPHYARYKQTNPQRLPGRLRCSEFVLLTDSPCHQCGCGHTDANRDGIQQRDYCFGQANGSNRICSETCNKKDIHDREHRFHGHFQNHGNGQQEGGACDRAFCVVDAGVTHQRLFEQAQTCF